MSEFTKEIILGDYHYELQSDGRLFSMNNWRGYGRRELSRTPNKYGYLVVRLSVAKGRRIYCRIHKLVANNFLPSPLPRQTQVRHLDGNKNNNDVSNLAWGTAKENAQDRSAHGNTQHGALHSAKVKLGQQAIGWNAPLTQDELSALEAQND